MSVPIVPIFVTYLTTLEALPDRDLSLKLLRVMSDGLLLKGKSWERRLGPHFATDPTFLLKQLSYRKGSKHLNKEKSNLWIRAQNSIEYKWDRKGYEREDSFGYNRQRSDCKLRALDSKKINIKIDLFNRKSVN